MALAAGELSSAPFPAPPPFWKHFTSENVSTLASIEHTTLGQEQDKDNISATLEYLRPPTPPSESYTVFGEEHTLSATLPSLGGAQLFPETSPTGGPIDHAYWLAFVTKSLLLNFLELTTQLAVNPSVALEKLEDIRRLFVNVHHLINTYRPHQARESLILMMENQLAEGRKEIEQCEEMKKKVEERLQFMARSVPEAGVGSADGAIDHVVSRKSLQQNKIRRMWEKIYALEDI